jgi:hypothetical protein
VLSRAKPLSCREERAEFIAEKYLHRKYCKSDEEKKTDKEA